MNNEKAKKISKVKLNINYVDFIGKVIAGKLLTKDKETLKSLYIENVKLKSANNVHRVADRTERPELKALLSKALAERKISVVDFKATSKALVAKIRTKVNNYVEA